MDAGKWSGGADQKESAGYHCFGICGGYQMLGQTISDPYQVESGGSMKGMGLLPAATELKQEKQEHR